MDYWLLSLSILQLFALSVGPLLLWKYLPSYLSKKAENLATKEDIAEITAKVEQVKSVYAKDLEQTKLKHQLSLAALDKRLEVYQEAYALWWKLVGEVHNKDRIGEAVGECQKWWVENNLYLDAEVRQAFKVAYLSAPRHSDILRSCRGSSRPEDHKASEENWKEIIYAGEAIVKAVKLPSLGKEEYKPVNPSEDGDD